MLFLNFIFYIWNNSRLLSQPCFVHFLPRHSGSSFPPFGLNLLKCLKLDKQGLSVPISVEGWVGTSCYETSLNDAITILVFSVSEGVNLFSSCLIAQLLSCPALTLVWTQGNGPAVSHLRSYTFLMCSYIMRSACVLPEVFNSRTSLCWMLYVYSLKAQFQGTAVVSLIAGHSAVTPHPQPARTRLSASPPPALLPQNARTSAAPRRTRQHFR